MTTYNNIDGSILRREEVRRITESIIHAAADDLKNHSPEEVWGRALFAMFLAGADYGANHSIK